MQTFDSKSNIFVYAATMQFVYDERPFRRKLIVFFFLFLHWNEHILQLSNTTSYHLNKKIHSKIFEIYAKHWNTQISNYQPLEFSKANFGELFTVDNWSLHGNMLYSSVLTSFSLCFVDAPTFACNVDIRCRATF